MSPKKNDFLKNQDGFGLLAAIFLLVVVSMFGVLIVRYTITSSLSSAEDYFWTQSLYSAESAVQLRILNHDGGVTAWGGFPDVAGVGTQATMDIFGGAGNVSTLRVTASHPPTSVSREIETKYIL